MSTTAAPTRQPITAEHDAFGRQWKLCFVGPAGAQKLRGVRYAWSNSFVPVRSLFPYERAELEALISGQGAEIPAERVAA